MPPMTMLAIAEVAAGMGLVGHPQIWNFAAFSQSQKMAPAGFCNSVEYMVSMRAGSRVTKSYLLAWEEKPCTNVWSAMWSLRQEPLPPRLSTEDPSSAPITSSTVGQAVPLAFAAFSTASL